MAEDNVKHIHIADAEEAAEEEKAQASEAEEKDTEDARKRGL